MTNQEFKEELDKYKLYLKPELYDVLITCIPVFSDEAKVDIVEKMREAESEMQQLAAYQQERIGILQRGLNQLNEIYNNLKTEFKKMMERDEKEEKGEAEKLISNI
jgi:hypothetical protein